MSVFPFLVGCGRSGTTLLRSLLNAHPDLAIPYESHFVVPLGEPGLRSRYETADGFDVPVFVGDLVGQLAFRHWGLSAADVRDHFDDEAPVDYPDAVRALYRLHASREGKSRFGDKTAIYVRSLSLLADLFPEARFVHVIRDGRDVALSWLDTGWDFGPRTAEEAALYWRYDVQRGRGMGVDLPGRYREVRYERLIRDPDGVLRDLCDFLELRYDSAMIESFRHADELLGSMPRPAHHRHLLLPPTVGLRDWRRQMGSEDRRVFEEIAGALLDELGYDTGPTRPEAG